MNPRLVAATVNSRSNAIASQAKTSHALDFATLGRAPLRMTLGSRRITSGDLQIVEAADELLQSEVPEPEVEGVSLLRGFNATIPSSNKSRARRRKMRSIDTPRIGLKKLGMNARGLLTDEAEDDKLEGQSVASEEDMIMIGGKMDRKGKGRESLSTSKTLGKDELVRQQKEIIRDKENVHVKRVKLTRHCISSVY